MVSSFVSEGVLLSAALVAALSLHISFHCVPMCLAPLCIVPCAFGLSTLGDAQQWPGKHLTLGYKCEQMQCVCNEYTALPRGHLPKIDHMEGDDAIRPQLMVVKCEMAISQIKQQPGNCASLLTQKSHTEKRYERHIKKL